MYPWHAATLKIPNGYVALSGVRIQRILCAQLFREMSGLPPQGNNLEVGVLCYERWKNFSDAIANLPNSPEIIAILGCKKRTDGSPSPASLAFLGVGRGKTERQAQKSCQQTCDNLWTLCSTILDYTELQPISNSEGDAEFLAELVSHIQRDRVLEVRRRWENLKVSYGEHPILESASFGFQVEEAKPQPEKTSKETDLLQLKHLFPWRPSSDSWRRLLEVLQESSSSKAFIVHIQGLPQVPVACTEAARAALAAAEEILDKEAEHVQSGKTVLGLQVSVLREHLLKRAAVLEGSALAARIFVTGDGKLSDALMATVKGCIDEESRNNGDRSNSSSSHSWAESMFQGGARFIEASSRDILAPFTEPSLDCLFDPQEASTFLRTPMPVDEEMPGIIINRSRTVPASGTSGGDAPLGYNVHRASKVPIALEEQMRFRHTYIIGQTGTGKSTLLSQMILHDIRCGRGVCVLDPHGALVDNILKHFPEERAEDLILVDVTDVDRPVGFNILRIEEEDPFQYRLARDLILDDIYSYLDGTYDMKKTGGPIFESHFRGMMGLLLGTSPPNPPMIPNLMILRLLYNNEDLRNLLCALTDDPLLEDFIKEAHQASGDASFANIAPYITSKFNRFISDIALRNIVCQNAMLNIDKAVSEGKVLLINLGKGRFGDLAAGLLASQIVSRIRLAVMKRGYSKDNAPFYLYADEFQLFADERFAELLAECRKYRLSLTLAHQYTKQLPEKVLLAVLGNVGTTAVFRVGTLDGDLLEPLYSPAISKRDLTSLPNFRCYVRTLGKLGQTPFSVELLPSLSKGNPDLAKKLRDLSASKYGRDRQEVEKEITSTYKAYNEGLLF